MGDAERGQGHTASGIRLAPRVKQTPLKPKLTAAFDATVDGVRINLMHANLLNDDRERLLGYTPRFEEMGKKSKGTSPAWRCAAPPFRRASAAVAMVLSQIFLMDEKGLGR